MSKPSHQISQETISEIFALAAELQAQHEQTYSIAELIEIGAQAHIAPEFIKQAIVQIQERTTPAAKRATIWENFSHVGAVIILLSLLTSFVSLLNDRSFSVARNQIQDSQLLPIEEGKLLKPLVPHHHPKHHLTHRENRYNQDTPAEYFLFHPKPVPFQHKHQHHDQAIENFY